MVSAESSAVFLQVRLDSTRLPRKALADLGGKAVLERCLSALSQVSTPLKVVVTEPASFSEVAALAEGAGWQVFSGSKNNVLDRFVQAARRFECRTIVRATADNPLVSAYLANLLLAEHLREAMDYSGYLEGPEGSGVEILNAGALETALSSGPDPYECEHVSPYLYRRPDKFKIHRPIVPDRFRYPEGRVTVDTAEDLFYLNRLWRVLDPQVPSQLEDVIDWLKENPR